MESVSFNLNLQWVLWMQKLKTHSFRIHSSKVPPLKPGARQNIAMYASPTASDFFLDLISTFLVHSPSFFPNLSQVFPVLAVANTGSCMGPQNKKGYLARRSK